ncbi:hypothetical protein JTE90_011367 [Oedothorax gibbosus]|uniref:Uncharacterized protein n=1 Tax=Oedothorax gibbosus TaxID=931172 RepID=A0AAV6VKP5_9ARAC|nr:hypothetical protein JTE90_011367 [Oedothorax gibbosus]
MSEHDSGFLGHSRGSRREPPKDDASSSAPPPPQKKRTKFPDEAAGRKRASKPPPPEIFPENSFVRDNRKKQIGMRDRKWFYPPARKDSGGGGILPIEGDRTRGG